MNKMTRFYPCDSSKNPGDCCISLCQPSLVSCLRICKEETGPRGTNPSFFDYVQCKNNCAKILNSCKNICKLNGKKISPTMIDKLISIYDSEEYQISPSDYEKKISYIIPIIIGIFSIIIGIILIKILKK